MTRPVIHRVLTQAERDKLLLTQIDAFTNSHRVNTVIDAANARSPRIIHPAPPSVIREAELADEELNRPRRNRFTELQIDLLVIASGVVAALAVAWLLVRVA